VSPSDEFQLAAGQLAHCWLEAVEFREHRQLDGDERITYNVAHTNKVEFSESADPATPPSATLHLNVTVEWRGADDEPVDPPFDLTMIVAGLFTWNHAAIDRDLHEAWLEWNGVYLVWPYVRSYIASITGMSSLPALTIYTMRVPDPPPRATDQAAPGTQGEKRSGTSKTRGKSGTATGKKTAAQSSRARAQKTAGTRPRSNNTAAKKRTPKRPKN
jgi:hypothetical protein